MRGRVASLDGRRREALTDFATVVAVEQFRHSSASPRIDGIVPPPVRPLVVVITGIGVETGRLRSAAATALVAAAMLPVLIMPLAADRLRRRAATA